MMPEQALGTTFTDTPLSGCSLQLSWSSAARSYKGQHHTELGCTPNLPDHKRQPVCCCVFKGGCCCSFEGLHVVLVSCCGGCCCSCFCNVTRTAPRLLVVTIVLFIFFRIIVAIVIVACNICIVTGRVCTIFSSIFPSTPYRPRHQRLLCLPKRWPRRYLQLRLGFHPPGKV